MMKKGLLVLVKTLIASCAVLPGIQAHAEAPFGLKVGASLAALTAQNGKPEKLGDDSYTFHKVPKPYPGFEEYLMQVTPTNGLCKVIGYGKEITTSRYGDDIKSEFNTLKDALSKKYGTPKGDYDFLRSGSIWKEDSEWMMSLYKKERYLVANWEPKEENGIGVILLQAKASGPSTGRVTLQYGLSNYKTCEEEGENKDVGGL